MDVTFVCFKNINIRQFCIKCDNVFITVYFLQDCNSTKIYVEKKNKRKENPASES